MYMYFQPPHPLRLVEWVVPMVILEKDAYAFGNLWEESSIHEVQRRRNLMCPKAIWEDRYPLRVPDLSIPKHG